MSDAEATTATDEARNLFEYPVTPVTLKETIRWLLANRDLDGTPKEMAAAMIWGSMGIGKSEIVQQVAAEWGCRVVAMHLPQFDPTDIKGVPVYFPPEHTYTDPETGKTQKLGGRVAWVASSYLPQQCLYRNVTRSQDCDDGVYHLDHHGENKLKLVFNFPAAEDVKLLVFDKTMKELARYNDGRQPDHDEDHIVNSYTVVNPRHEVIITLSKAVNLEDIFVLVEDKAVLFLDELSAAAPETMNAALQLVLDRRVGEYDVPTDVPVVAAGNRESDAAFVNPMPAPLANRFCHLRLHANTNDWVEWALSQQVHPDIVGFIKWKGSAALHHFEQSEQIEGDLGFPSPRSWVKLGCQLGDHLSDISLNAIICGYIGKKRGHEFIQHRKVSSKLPNTDDILRGKEVKMPADSDIGANYALAIALCFKLNDYYKDYYNEELGLDQVDQQRSEWKVASESFAKFVDRNLGDEMTVLTIHIVSRHLGISFTKFAGEESDKFAKKYRPIIRKMVVVKSS